MPHFKCERCRLRLHSRTSGTGDLCPGCESPFEAVSSLGELVGFQSIMPPDDGWFDDTATLRAEAVALAIPDAPQPRLEPTR